MQALVAEYEAAKKQESERRTAYKNEKNELEDEINKLEARLKASSDTDPADSRKWKEVDEQYQLVSDRLQKQRLVLVMPSLLATLHSVRVLSDSGEESPRNLRSQPTHRRHSFVQRTSAVSAIVLSTVQPKLRSLSADEAKLHPV